MREVIDRQETKREYAFLSLLRSGDMVNRYLELKLQRYHISPTHFGVMNALLTHDNEMTPTEISKWLFRSKHTISATLKVMESKGTVRQRVNTKDYRSKYVSLTEKGLKCAEPIRPMVAAMMETALSSFSEEEIDTLSILLRGLRKHLYQQFDNHKQGPESIGSETQNTCTLEHTSDEPILHSSG